MTITAPSQLAFENSNIQTSEVAVLRFERHISELCLMLQSLLHADKVAFWFFNPDTKEMICLQDKIEPERIGISIGIDEVSSLIEALKKEQTIMVSNAEHDERFANVPMTAQPSNLILSYIYCDPEHQGILVCRRQNQIEWPANTHQLIQYGVEFAIQLFRDLSVSVSLLKNIVWQQRLNQQVQQIKTDTASAYISSIATLLKRELNARSVLITETLQKKNKKISIKLIAGLYPQENVAAHKAHFILDDADCLFSEKEWVLCKEQQSDLKFITKSEQLLVIPLRLNAETTGHVIIGFNQLAFEAENYYQLIAPLIPNMNRELLRYKQELELRLSAVAFETNKGCIVTDPSLNILRVNQAFCTITGYPMDHVMSLKLGRDIWTLSERHQKAVELAQFCSFETERQRISGEFYPQKESWTPVFDDSNSLSHYVVNIEDQTERMKTSQRIRELAFFDELTGLANRRRLLEQVYHHFNAAKETELVGALLFIDLDHFKNINDSLGHAAGDWVLQQVAERLKPFFAEQDLLARLGGDEFVALLPGISSNPPQAEMHAINLSESIIEAVAEPYHFSGQILHLGASIGITLYPTKEQKPEDMLKQADTAMYQAKEDGRNTVSVFNAEMQRKVDKRLRIHNNLRDALRNKELSLHYQPQHMIQTGEIIGAEALIRWNSPKEGMISPVEFIPIAEETDLIIDIGQWVMEEACRQYMHWYHRDGLVLPQISVNVSAKQFHNPDFVDLVYATLDKTQMLPEALNLEITESVVVEGLENTIQKMTELKSIGINFSLDDFGTGYSSLGYLTRLPVNELKIDRTFIKGIPNDVSNMAIAEAVLAMARHLGFNVTAEGVETRQQLEFLKQHACHFYQGYLASKPLSAEFMTNYLAQCLKK